MKTCTLIAMTAAAVSGKDWSIGQMFPALADWGLISKEETHHSVRRLAHDDD